jgi:hypothetical protein
MSWENLPDYKLAKTLFIRLIPNPHSTPPECLSLTPVPFSFSQLWPFYLFAGLFLSYGYDRSSHRNSFPMNLTMSSWLFVVVYHHHHSLLLPTFYLCHHCDLLLYMPHKATPIHGEIYLLINHSIIMKTASHLDLFSHLNTM